ncbi:hypothetical protein [Cupriavidus sp. D39]|uniref:hypothetical protein n=1 Tax=Cupriavidus sp. D39 TaxID=2997877 RepID=UPI00226F688E|nr:hypothetical protein [Cupriavidus sp. D39]MCY0855023.1 hypothetical protein [Cupriavidus sp. D39]
MQYAGFKSVSVGGMIVSGRSSNLEFDDQTLELPWDRHQNAIGLAGYPNRCLGASNEAFASLLQQGRRHPIGKLGPLLEDRLAVVQAAIGFSE